MLKSTKVVVYEKGEEKMAERKTIVDGLNVVNQDGFTGEVTMQRQDRIIRRRKSKGGQEESKWEKSDNAELPIMGVILQSRKMNLGDFYKIYCSYCDKIAKEYPETKKTIYPQVSIQGFRHTFDSTKTIPTTMFANLLKILGYRMVIVPDNADVTVSCNGLTLEGKSNTGKDSIQLFTRDRIGKVEKSADRVIQFMDGLQLSKVEVKLPKAITVRQRPSRMATENNTEGDSES